MRRRGRVRRRLDHDPRREGLTRIVDVVAGRGELAIAVARWALEFTITAVDVVSLSAGLPGRIRWYVALRDALLVALEWLDLVPCPVLRIDAHREPWVALIERPYPPSAWSAQLLTRQ